MPNKITLVYSEDHDWVALYIDGKMVNEGHSLSIRSVIIALGFQFEVKCVSNEWAENQGRFPKNEKDCAPGIL